MEQHADPARLLSAIAGKPFELPIPIRPATISADVLMEKVFPEPRWAVEGFIPEGFTIYAGPPKIGKSWFMLNAACGVALGGMVAGKVEVEKGDVLTLFLEDTERRVQERLHTVLQGAQPPPGLHIATAWPAFGDGGAEHIAQWLHDHRNARMVIVDTFAKIRGVVAGNQNLYSSDYEAAGQLKKVADEYGVAIVAVHHTRKAVAEDPLEMVNASNGLVGAADTICVLRKEIGRPDANLYVRGRDVPEADHALSFDIDTCTWNLLGDASEYRMSRERQEIVKLLVDSPEPLSPKQIAEALDKKGGAIRKLLHSMTQAGTIAGHGGTYGPPPTLRISGASVTGKQEPMFDGYEVIE